MTRIIVGDHVEDTETAEISLAELRKRITILTRRIDEAQEQRAELNRKIQRWRTKRTEWRAFKDTLDP